MIELRNVGFAYNGNEVFHNLTLAIAKGDFVVLIGDTGSGKTTLMQLLIGELLPSSGEIHVSGTRVDQLNKRQLTAYRRSVGFIFEEIVLLEERTVAENVALPLVIEGKYRKVSIDEKVKKYLGSVNLSEHANAFPRELSIGQCQRTAIARALVNEPLLLAADCPTARLDSRSAAEIIAILANENIRGMTVLLTLSDLIDHRLLPRTTVFYRIKNGQVDRFLPETQE